MRFLLLTAVLAGSATCASARLPESPAQTTPRGVEKQARADRKLDKAHTVRRDESLSKTPRLVRERDKLTHHKQHKPQPAE